MNHEPDKQTAAGFEGFDNASDPTKLAPGMCAEGLNMHCRGDGYVETRPGLRLVTNFMSQVVASPTLPFYATTAPLATAVNGMCYYDQPGEEYLIAIWNDYVWRIGSAGNNVAATYLINGYAPPPTYVPFDQLVDRVFWLKNGVLTWAKITAGVLTSGTVTQFSDATAMPTWSRIVVQNFRLLAYEADANKLYTSAIGQAHNASDWVKTENIRVGDGDGDPARALLSGQGGFVNMINGSSAWQIDITGANVADWSSLRVTKLTGCVEGRTAACVGQDVYFLSHYGVVNLGSLQATDSISASDTLSAPIQPYIDRINWSAITNAFATTWRDYYLLALPLDSNTYANHVFAFHLRTRRWMAPWVYTLPSNSVGALAYSGLNGAVVTNFADKAETLFGDTAGRIFRVDDTVAYDEGLASAQTTYASWAVLRRMDHATGQQTKQPLYAELVFQGSTGVDTMVSLRRDGAAALTSAGAFSGQVGTTFTGAGGLEKKRYLARDAGRYYEAALQVWATSGKLKLREAALSAFIDPPFFT